MKKYDDVIAGRNSLYCHNIISDVGDWKKLTEEIKSEDNKIIFL